jgi:hypothetical protein
MCRYKWRPLACYIFLIEIKFAAHFSPLTAAYVCQKLLNLARAFKRYKQKTALAAFFWATL